jgi:hypothetical protein
MKRKLKECFSEPPFETWEANAIYPEFVLGKALPKFMYQVDKRCATSLWKKEGRQR